MVLRDNKVDMLNRGCTRKENTPIQNLTKRIKGSIKKPRIRFPAYGWLCVIVFTTAMVSFYGSSLFASQNDSYEQQVLLSDFDSNEPFQSSLFTAGQWVAGSKYNNEDSNSLCSVDCNDGACGTRCSLKWTYKKQGKDDWANLQLWLSCTGLNDPRKIPVNLSEYDAISFYIKRTDASTSSVGVRLCTTESENENLKKVKLKVLAPSDIGSQWGEPIIIPIKDDPNLTNLDLRRVHAIEFVSWDLFEAASNVFWIDQVCLIPDPNSRHDDITLENDKVAFKLTKGHGSLFSVCDKDTGIELLSAGPLERRLLYSLAYISDTNELCWTNNCLAEEFSGDFDPNDLRFSGRWVHQWGTSGAEVLVTAELPTDSALAMWTIDVNVTGDARLETLEFPTLVGVSKLGTSGEDDLLLVPHNCGRIYLNPSENLARWQKEGYFYPTTCQNMQFTAYYDSRTGFYVASSDSNGLSKMVSWDRRWYDWATMKIVSQYLHSVGYDSSFETGTRLGVFHGDWTTAASIYRDWAQQQWWAEGIINKGTPDWLTRIGIAKNYELYRNQKEQMDYDDWTQKIAEHNDYFEVPTLAVFKGWENGGIWAFGDYFPPQDGWNEFESAMRNVRSLNAYPLVNVGALRICENSPAWKSQLGQDAAIHTIENEPWSGEDACGKVFYMCLESTEWQDYMKGVVSELAKHDVAVIQLDGFPTIVPPCHSRIHEHGELVGCGARPNKLFESIRLLRDELLESYRDLAFSAEGGAEFFLPILDSWQYRDCYAEALDLNVNCGLSYVVPLYQFVYHKNLIFIDAYPLGPWPGYSADPNYDNLAIGRAFVWGGICGYNMQNALADYRSDTSFNDSISLLRKCAKARIGFLRDFLVFGRMLPPPKVEVPTIHVKVEEGLHHNAFSGEVPSILTSAWQSESGDVAVIVLNIGEDILNTTVPLSPYSQYVHPGARMHIYDDNDLVATRIVEEDLYQEPIELQPLHFATFLLGE